MLTLKGNERSLLQMAPFHNKGKVPFAMFLTVFYIPTGVTLIEKNKILIFSLCLARQVLRY